MIPCDCPRSNGEMVALLPGRPDDGTCTYCGSLNPNEFMSRLEAGDVELDPTDKDYKVYIRNKSGALFKQTYGQTYEEKAACGHDEKKHRWVTREINETKFYFYHLSGPQKQRFVELLNLKKLHIGSPGHFYRLPFFVKGKET